MAFTNQPGGGQNIYIPNYGWSDAELGGALCVNYSRNPASFKLNQWAKLYPTKNMSGVYQRWDPANGARVVAVSDFIWPLGNDVPKPVGDYFENATFLTARYGEAFMIPQQTIDQCPTVDLAAEYIGSHAQAVMTVREINAITAATTTGNWAGNTAATGTILGGGPWNNSNATTEQWIKKGIQAAMQAVELSSGGLVQGSDLTMVIGPAVARAISQTAEFEDFIKQNTLSLAVQRGDASVVIPSYGIPNQLYGLRNIIVDNTVRVTSQPGATTAASFAMGNAALFITRKGEIMGNQVSAGRDWSTIGIFSYEEMAVRTEYQALPQRLSGVISDNYAVGVIAPQSGYMCANVLS